MSKTENINPTYNIQRILNRELIFRSIDPKELAQEMENPKITLNVSVSTSKAGKDSFEVLVHLDITAVLDKISKTFFFIDLKTAGYFNFENPPMDDNFERILHIFCPSVLFPYMRETIDNCLVKAGLAPLLMNPINFEAIYLARKEQEKATVGNDTYNLSSEKEEILKLKEELEALKSKVSGGEKTKQEHLEGLKAKTNQLKSKK